MIHSICIRALFFLKKWAISKRVWGYKVKKFLVNFHGLYCFVPSDTITQNDVIRAYFRHLLRAVTTRNTFSSSYWYFHTPKFLNLHGGFLLRIAQNLLQFAFFIYTAHLPCLSKIWPGKWFKKKSYTKEEWTEKFKSISWKWDLLRRTQKRPHPLLCLWKGLIAVISSACASAKLKINLTWP